MNPVRQWRTLSAYERSLVLLFLLTVPFVNPWVRGDGVGYYAYARALLIDGNLRFEKDWLAANPSFLVHRLDPSGHLRADQYTATGHLNNRFTVGPAILWAPFLVVAHVFVLAANSFGAHIPADGYSRPYLVLMASATAFYGFLGLCLSFRLARQYFEERWAFLGTVGLWFASSLPVYMYFNPSWSHAHSAFAVSFFLWYWHRTRRSRTRVQWVILGLLSGLIINVYYLNAVFLLVPLLESVWGYWRAWRTKGSDRRASWLLFSGNLLYAAAVLVGILPTLLTRLIIYDNPLESGYNRLQDWYWTAPARWSVLFSSNHGLLSWTPLLIPAVWGLFWLRRQDKELAAYLLVVFSAFYYLIASYPVWDGLSSFGNRFFVSLTPVFVLGLVASISVFAGWFKRDRHALGAASLITAVFILWNAGFVFQWGIHLVPARGPISWRAMVHNQLTVVPAVFVHKAKSYFVARKELMNQIEREDMQWMEFRKAPEER